MISIEPLIDELVVSIINFRTADLTIQCVCSVLEDMKGINGHIVVVDNLSGDGSDNAIEAWIAAQPAETPVTLVRSTTNSGYSGGHNQGMAVRRAQYYLILNSDAVLRPGCLEHMLQMAREMPRAGLITPRLEDEDTTPQISHFRFFGPLSELIRAAETGPLTQMLNRFDIPLGSNPDMDEIGWASFACILLRGEMVTKIGPMDEGYFLYFEDSEYCLRAHRAGWSIVHEPRARTVHFRGGSAPVKELTAAKKRVPSYYYASRTRFLYQAHGWVGLLAANMLWHLGRGIARLRGVLGKSVPMATEAEAKDIWINFLDPLGNSRAPGA